MRHSCDCFPPPLLSSAEATNALVHCVVGYGDSCFQPNRQYAEIAKDVTELLDHLELPRAAILGYSSGEHMRGCAVNHPIIVCLCR